MTSENRYRLQLLDRRDIVRHGLETVLGRLSDVRVVGVQTELAPTLVIVSSGGCDAVMVDPDLPSIWIARLAEVARKRPRCPLIAVGVQRTSSRWGELRGLGVHTVVGLDVAVARLHEELLAVLGGGRPRAEGRPRALGPAPLTARESAIVHGLMAGRAPSEIAAELNLARTTVSTVLRRLKTKLGVESTFELLLRLSAGQPTLR